MSANSDSEPNFFALMTEMNPLTGGADYIVRDVTPQTTVAELIQWHHKRTYNPSNWKPEHAQITIQSKSP